MLNVLYNGSGKQELAERALPPLKHPKSEIVARILCKQNGQDPDEKDGGRVCLDQCIADDNAWCVDSDDNGPWVYWWMRYIEDAKEILETLLNSHPSAPLHSH